MNRARPSDRAGRVSPGALRSPPSGNIWRHDIASVEARQLAHYALLTGEKRRDTIQYMEGVIYGRWGTVSQAARDYARRVLDNMASKL